MSKRALQLEDDGGGENDEQMRELADRGLNCSCILFINMICTAYNQDNNF